MRNTWLYRHVALPILVLLIRFCLAFLQPILPEPIIDEGEDALDQFYGSSHKPEKIMRAARKLSADDQEKVYNNVLFLLDTQEAVMVPAADGIEAMGE